MNCVFAIFVALLLLMWVATLLDWTLNLSWDWDKQILLLASPMLLFAAFVRFCCIAIFNFVGGKANGG